MSRSQWGRGVCYLVMSSHEVNVTLTSFLNLESVDGSSFWTLRMWSWKLKRRPSGSRRVLRAALFEDLNNAPPNTFWNAHPSSALCSRLQTRVYSRTPEVHPGPCGVDVIYIYIYINIFIYIYIKICIYINIYLYI